MASQKAWEGAWDLAAKKHIINSYLSVVADSASV